MTTSRHNLYHFLQEQDAFMPWIGETSEKSAQRIFASYLELSEPGIRNFDARYKKIESFYWATASGSIIALHDFMDEQAVKYANARISRAQVFHRARLSSRDPAQNPFVRIVHNTIALALRLTDTATNNQSGSAMHPIFETATDTRAFEHASFDATIFLITRFVCFYLYHYGATSSSVDPTLDYYAHDDEDDYCFLALACLEVKKPRRIEFQGRAASGRRTFDAQQLAKLAARLPIPARGIKRWNVLLDKIVQFKRTRSKYDDELSRRMNAMDLYGDRVRVGQGSSEVLPTTDEMLDKIALESMERSITNDLREVIRTYFAHDLYLAAVNGSKNVLFPDEAVVLKVIRQYCKLYAQGRTIESVLRM